VNFTEIPRVRAIINTGAGSPLGGVEGLESVIGGKSNKIPGRLE
jgi:hypothetical protein